MRLPTEWDRVCENVDNLDFEPIMVKIVDTDEGAGWSPTLASIIEKQYRQFLKLISIPGAVVVPTKCIDTFWHYHILDTKQYRVDCEDVFGAFVDHFPYFGMRGDEDRLALQDAFDASLRLVRDIFGGSADWAGTMVASLAADGVKPANCMPTCLSSVVPHPETMRITNHTPSIDLHTRPRFSA